MLDKQLLLNELRRSKKGYEKEKVIRWLGEEKCEGAIVVLTGLIEMVKEGYFDK